MRLWFRKRPQDLSEKRSSPDRRIRAGQNGRPGLAIAAALLCGPIALISVPAFWLAGVTVLQALLLTFLLQLAVFVAVVGIGCWRSSGRHAESPWDPDRETRVAPDLDIWHSYSALENHGHCQRVALIGQACVQNRQIATDLAQLGYDIHHTTAVDDIFEIIRMHPTEWNFLIVDLDLFDTLEGGVDELMSFRKECAAIPVLLLSGSVGRDELSDHRRAIGDVTLRKPVFRCRLLTGIDAMRLNREGQRPD
ncbi:hypothetical protein [Histidinibacterium lentulum]|uniref:Response regulator n=1 Tax=Histidinibacterium lentulum TaxID=2480588 RepID=A0A3N2R572_9RHOB|nr:hypothetical protein [Histidinibacterium lentulum]ROU02547.1 hypothetical protein EAT49_09445 [Histidinibacterium lentulum]